MTDGRLNFDTKISTDGFEKGIKSIDAKVDALTTSFGKLKAAIGSISAAIGITLGIRELIESTAEVNAQISQIEQTFGSLEGSARAAMQRVADASGILETRLHAVGTGIYAFARTSGMEGTQALSLMEEALTVAADSAAYYDRSLEDTSATLQSFLKGNYANDAALGLSATETTRNAAAMKLYSKSFQELSEAQKQITLLNMVKDANRLSGAEGQAAREAEGWENVLGNLKEAWRQLLAVIGQPGLRIAVDIVQRMTAAITALTEKAQIAVNTLNRLFGWEQQNASAVTSAIAQSTEEQDGLTQAVEETAKAQDSMLAGFDKITKLGEEDTGSAASAVTDVTPVVETAELLPEVEEAAEKSAQIFEEVLDITAPMQEAWDAYGDSIEQHLRNNFGSIKDAVIACKDATADWLKNIDYKPLLESVDGLLEALEPFTENIGEGLAWFWNNVLLPIGKWTIEDALPASLDVLSGALDALDGILEALKPYGMWLWEEFISPLAEWTGEIIVTGLEDLADVLHNIGDWIRDHPDAAAVIGSLTAAFFGLYSLLSGGIVATAIGNLGMFITTLGTLNVTAWIIVAGIAAWVYVITELHDNWDDIMDVFEDSGGVFGFLAGWIEYVREDIENFFDSSELGRKWREFWEGVGAYFYDKVQFFKTLLRFGKEKFTEALDSIRNKYTEIKNTIRSSIARIPGYLSEKLQSAYEHTIKPFEKIGEWAADRVEDIKAPFLDIADWFRDTFSEAWQRVKDVFSSGGEVFHGIQDGISSVFSNVVNGLIDGINNTLSVPFDTINSALGTIRSWGIWLPWAGDWQPFEWLPEVTIPKIPRLAQGTVVPANYGEFLAVLGDNKREAEVVSPISQIEQAMENVLRRTDFGGGDLHLILELESKPIYKGIIKLNNRSIRMTGKNPLNPEKGGSI